MYKQSFAFPNLLVINLSFSTKKVPNHPFLWDFPVRSKSLSLFVAGSVGAGRQMEEEETAMYF